MAPSSLTQLLVGLTQHAAPLAHTDSLEDFKQQAHGVCSSIQLLPQQLSAVRGELQALDAGSWQHFANAGVVAADVAKWVLVCLLVLWWSQWRQAHNM